jgi:hypothetical protein
VARHTLGRHRLHAAALSVLILSSVLPVAVSGFAHPDSRPAAAPVTAGRSPASVTVPEDPRSAARHDAAEVRMLADRAAAKAAQIAAVKAAAAAKAQAARIAAVKAQARAKAVAAARIARQRQQAAAARAIRTAASKSSTARSGSGGYRGRNHMWYPALGISYPVSWFPCSRSRPPDNFVYRWGCAGRNNVYLMAHAAGKFGPLNRAYYSGRLARGQLLVYADNAGRIHRYRLVWSRTYPPLTTASWAWASQARSSATLQTCIGSNSQLRLFVRFVEV